LRFIDYFLLDTGLSDVVLTGNDPESCSIKLPECCDALIYYISYLTNYLGGVPTLFLT